MATGYREIGGVADRLINAIRGSRRDETGLEVRLLANDCVPAPSDEMAVILEQLRLCARVRLDNLVRDTAAALYRSEMDRGGANLDLGIFGPRLFEPVMRSAIHAGNGRLWEICAPAPQANGS